jgi:hypothetical protein
MEVKGTTDVGTSYLNTLLSSSFVTTGETHTCQNSGDTVYALWAADNSSVLWESLHKEKSSTAAYPSDWSSDTDSSTAFTTIDNSLVAYYPFNGNANDFTSNGRNLTFHGDTSLIEGKDNFTDRAYSFDGVGDYLEYTADIPSFDNYTISLWAQPASAGTYKAMFSSDNNSGKGFQIDLDGSKFRIRIAGVGNLVLGTALLNGDWTFIAFTYDGTNYKGYMNDNITKSDSGGTTEFDLFRIGRNRNGNTYFSGAIDELRIYNRALTDSEISSLYAN